MLVADELLISPLPPIKSAAATDAPSDAPPGPAETLVDTTTMVDTPVLPAPVKPSVSYGKANASCAITFKEKGSADVKTSPTKHNSGKIGLH